MGHRLDCVSLRRPSFAFLSLFLILGTNSFRYMLQAADLSSYVTNSLDITHNAPDTNIVNPISQGIEIPGLTAKEADALVDTFEHLSAETEDELLDKLHGREFQYRLACPHETIPEYLVSNATVIVGYHVGMMNNWRSVFSDQLNTLHHCGLGRQLAHLYLTYSQPGNSNALGDLKSILNRYPFANRTIIQESIGQPIEGAAINMVHADCQNQTFPQTTIAFYFHTKGTTRYTPDWQHEIAAELEYGTSLYWRKYMEYFTIERPEICMNAILKKDKVACGVWWTGGRTPLYGGNFWSASCNYLNENVPMEITSIDDRERRHVAENWIVHPMREKYSRPRQYASKFHVASNPPFGLYKNLHRPEGYDDYSRRWIVSK